ncbi:MAG: methyltransferase domain-containing protein [Magnetococcales bacterium]|nr:methyltransferase domain-containing protein [Magnetococcales bacterium]
MTKPMEKQEILDLMRTFQGPEVVMAAHKLSLFDAIGKKSLSAIDISHKIEASVRGCTILLDALVALGLLLKNKERYQNTPVGLKTLCSDGDDTIINSMNHINELMESWRRLPESVLSGHTNKKLDLQFSENSEVNRSFIGAMAELGRPNGRIIAENLNLASYNKLLDVGGGPGAYCEEILRVNPQMFGVIADLPITIESARPYVEKGGFAERISFIAADFYNDPNVELGSNYDVVLISNVLHMEGEVQNRKLIKKLYNTMEPDGLLIIHETIISEDHTSPLDRTFFAVNMLVNTQRGNSYSFNEIKGWLVDAGFGVVEFIDCFENPSLMTAKKIMS